MESFQQSGAKISPVSRESRPKHDTGPRTRPLLDLREVKAIGGLLGVRASAIMNEIVPLRISLSNTADAGEYDFDAGVETLE